MEDKDGLNQAMDSLANTSERKEESVVELQQYTLKHGKIVKAAVLRPGEVRPIETSLIAGDYCNPNAIRICCLNCSGLTEDQEAELLLLMKAEAFEILNSLTLFLLEKGIR